MVHVPFFNIELPEPKLGALIPDGISTALGCTAKALEYGKELLHPPTPEDLKAFEQSFEATIPREFDRVRKRYAEGKIVNDEQLSSELEDASFDWYRRQLRTSVIGATDEEMEDVAARRLGLAGPSLQAAVQNQRLADAVSQAGGVDLAAEMQDAVEFKAMCARQEEQQRKHAERRQRLADLRRQVRPTTRQALSTISNASGGLLLGVLLFKSAFMVASRVFKRRKPQQRPPQPRRQAPPAAAPQLQQAAAPTAAAAAAQPRRPQVAATSTPQTPARQPTSSKTQQQGKEPAQGAAATTGADARKPRPVKKR